MSECLFYGNTWYAHLDIEAGVGTEPRLLGMNMLNHLGRYQVIATEHVVHDNDLLIAPRHEVSGDSFRPTITMAECDWCQHPSRPKMYYLGLD